MLKNTKSYFETIIVGIFFIIIFFTANSFLGWGYDEYGAVVSHLELDDKRFIDEYINHDVKKVALLYNSDLSSLEKVNLLSRYSSSEWRIDKKTSNSVKECAKKTHLHKNSRHVKVDIFTVDK